jgi:hypothetical protein
MKTGIVFLTLMILVGMSWQSWGQPGRGQGRGMGPGPGGRMYDPQTEVTVKGEVTEVGAYPSMGPGAVTGMNYRGVTLKTDQGELRVHLCPAWYMDEQKLGVKVGDTLEVTGAKTTQDQIPVILAREVGMNGKKIMLRDNQGFPVWRGQGRGMGGPGRGGTN